MLFLPLLVRFFNETNPVHPHKFKLPVKTGPAYFYPEQACCCFIGKMDVNLSLKM